MTRRTYSWMHPNVEVKNLSLSGKGIFANKKILKDDIISVFGGYVITRQEELLLPEEFNDEGVQIGENFIMGIKDASELEDASYINHSCNPNAGYKGQIFLVAMRDIMPDEEITFDYAMCLFHMEGEEKYSFECACNSNDCRKIITDDDWKSPILQKKYDGYFQWYLQDKIQKIKYED